MTKAQTRKYKYYWIRIGDGGDYQQFDSPWEAGYEIGRVMGGFGIDRRATVKRRGDMGIQILNTEFQSNNYISLYRGGLQAEDKSHSLTIREFDDVMDGYNEGWQD